MLGWLLRRLLARLRAKAPEFWDPAVAAASVDAAIEETARDYPGSKYDGLVR